MKSRVTIKGLIGLLVGAAAIAYMLLAGPATTPARAQPQGAPSTERIDVEQGVDFPYDI